MVLKIIYNRFYTKYLFYSCQANLVGFFWVFWISESCSEFFFWSFEKSSENFLKEFHFEGGTPPSYAHVGYTLNSQRAGVYCIVPRV